MAIVTLDQMLQRIGSLGVYQARLLSILSYILVFSVGYPFLLVTFLIIEPPWKCVHNSSSCTLTGEFRPGDAKYDFRCSIARGDWQFCGARTSVITEFELICDKASFNLLSPSMFFVGTIAADFCCGILSDKFGRKPIMLIFGFGGSLFGLIAAFSPMYWLYTVCRFFVGFCYAATFVPMYTLCTEFVGADRRHVSGTVIWFAWTFSVMMLAGIAYLLHDWRSITIAGAAPGLVMPLMWWCIPESIRFLFLKGRDDEAEKILHKIAKVNKHEYPDETLDVSFLDKNQKKGSLKDLVRTRKMLHTTVALFIILLITTMVYLAVTISSPSLGGNMYLNVFLVGVVEIPANLMGMWLIRRFGRRNVVSVSLIVAAVGAFIVVLLTTYDPGNHIGFTTGRIAVSLVAKLSIGISYITLVIFSAECFPSVIRSTGFAVTNAGVDVGGLISPFIVKLDLVNVLLPYGVIGGSALFAGLLCLTLSDTGNTETMEILSDKETFLGHKDEESRDTKETRV